MLTRIQATNFLSWAELDFQLNPQVTLIDGWNADDNTSEGSGKSGILNALVWCLYGKLPKDSKIDDVIKSGEKGCSVTLTWEDGTQVTRSRKPNDIFIVKSDGEHRGSTAKETEKLVERLVGLSFDTFCQTIYFAQNYNKSFISASQEDKAKIFSEVQDLSVFDKAKDLAHKKAKEAGQEVLVLENKVSEVGYKLQNCQTRMESVAYQISAEKSQNEVAVNGLLGQVKSIKDKWEIEQREFASILERLEQDAQSIESNLERNRERLTELQNNVPEGSQTALEETSANKQTFVEDILWPLQNSLKSHSDLGAERSRKQERGNTLGQKYSKVEARKQELLAMIQNPQEGTCPTCGSSTGISDTSHLQQEVETLEADQRDLVSEMTEIKTFLDQPYGSVEELTDQLARANLQVQEFDRNIKVLQAKETERATHLKMIENVEGDIQRFEAQLSVAQEKIEAQKVATYTPNVLEVSQLETLQKQVEELNSIDFEAKLEEAQSAIKEEVSQLEATKVELSKGVEEKKDLENRCNTLKAGFKEVKSYVFNALLNELNVKVEQYLERLFEIPVSVTFVNDEGKIKTDVVINGEERGLGLLSGGQFRRVSLAVDLSLSDIISARSGSQFGFTAWDEYMKDLSEQSMSKVLDIFSERKQPTLLIEHNSIFKNIVNSTFMVKLENGTSFSEEVN